MIINSKYHDYYDAAANTGVDKTIIYDRAVSSLPIKLIDVDKEWRYSNLFPSSFWRSTKPEYSLLLIGFCGRTHLCLVKIIKKINDANEYLYLYKEDIQNEFEILSKKKDKHYKNSFKNIWDRYENKEYTDVFIKYKTPIFLQYLYGLSYKYDDESESVILNFYGDTKFTILNPKLKTIKFFKVKDTYTAFQEIQSFISGVIGNKEKEIVNITDKDKINQHGFDYKWSFRNPDPPKRKQKK